MKMDEPMALPAIRCDVTMDDIVAFNEYHMLLSPMALRQRAQMIRIFTTIFVVEFGLVGIFVRGILPPEVGWWGWLLPPLCALVFGGGAFFAVRSSFNRRKKRLSNWMRNRIRKLYSEGENKSVLCEHVLEVSESGFTERTAYF